MTAEELLFERYRGKKLLLDSNLLLLYLVGSFQRTLVERFKRTNEFSLGEYDLLASIVRQFQFLVTTPHILTEVSNLSNALPSNIKEIWLQYFALQIDSLEEVRTAASVICRETSYNPFGLTDAALQNASADMLVLSEDFRLTGVLSSLGVATINFRDLAAMLPD